MAHRINNELASVIGRASLIAARSSSDDVKTALAAVTRILHHCADVHRALEMPAHSSMIDASSYIRTLCQSIKRARLDDKGIELVLVVRPVQMRSENCWRLGMIVSELITNSVRHAFDGPGGTIRVELSASGPYVQCCVMDNGSGRNCGTPGQGLKIVKALARELNGQIVHRFAADGALSMLMFPLGGEAPQPEWASWVDDEQWGGRKFVAS
ncbi:sensor histidine kinase [Bradyrhizobium sp.]|uniref:sensor histidine kinase n=1 Tax=Bradyrhizobium sp. TaxID=376 RepID=UPI003C446DC3